MAQLNGMGFEKFEHFQNRGGFSDPERAREALAQGHMTNSQYNGNLVQDVTDVYMETFIQQDTSSQAVEPLDEVLDLISRIDDPEMRDLSISSYRSLRQQKVRNAYGQLNLTEAFCEEDALLKAELSDKGLEEQWEGLACTEEAIAALEGKEERDAEARERIAKALEADKQKKAAEAEKKLVEANAAANAFKNPQWRQVEDIPKEWARLSGDGPEGCDFGGSERKAIFELRDPSTAAEYLFFFSRLKAEWVGKKEDELTFQVTVDKKSPIWVSDTNPNLFMWHSAGLSRPQIYLVEDGRALRQHPALDGKPFDAWSDENFGQKFLPSSYSRWSVDTSETEPFGDEKYRACAPSSYAQWLDATWTDEATGKRYNLRQLLGDG
ncbi:hypothetical protein N9L80_02775 [Luminiphilus sp.]|nr:hypothetical protein [Luminiphilus sp.]